MNVTVDGLADAVIKTLGEYEAQTVAQTRRAVEKTAEQCRKDIMQGAPKDSGKYQKSWRKKLSFMNAKESRYTVYSTRYQLTHLLEYGHEKWIYGTYTGGTVSGKPHIRPAEMKAETNLINELKRTL